MRKADELQGLLRIVPAQVEPARNKVHWDYLLEEMAWLATDFHEERKVKIVTARKIAKAVMKWHEEKELALKKIASNMAKDVRAFWKRVGDLVRLKKQAHAERQRKAALTKRMDQLVDQTVQFSSSIARDMKQGDGEGEEESEDESGSEMEVDQTADQAQGDDEEQEEEQEEESSASDSDEPRDLSLRDLIMGVGAEEEDSEDRRARIDRVAAAASKAQPTGFTLSTTKVSSQIPFLFRGTLREYQLIGLDWLRHMWEKDLNVILADEMGLGKTVQTISLLAWLACERNIWGPHLIIVPSSVLLNWEIEFKRFCPALKIVTYYGTQQERRAKRVGWSKPNSFHVCITSYALAVSDHQVFRRKHWHYMILDEAQNIKNFKSQRWQRLLTMPSKHRLLLTGTPLQNNLMELWSLMHFLMPHCMLYCLCVVCACSDVAALYSVWFAF